MPRRRKSGVEAESFAIRWHSIADPNTPSVDIMSSPDPLNEPTIAISSVAPQSSSRRVTRSQRSQRFMSLDDSPRKRTFELELGGSRSPQRLLVTVETEADDIALTSGTRRKLFKSPLPSPTRQQMGRTTTTTVPLRDSIEDELSTPTTPRRRGRPRISNGTPIPSAGIKRRAGTPIRRSPRRQRTSKSLEENTEEVHLEATAQATPKSARRGRPPKNRVIEPSSELGTAKRGGRRRQALAPDELVEIAEEAAAAAERSSIRHAAQMSENDMDLVQPPSELGNDDQVAGVDVASNADTESDIWMATMSDKATPVAVAQTAAPDRAHLRSDVARESAQPEAEDNFSQPDDYGYLAPAASDSSSMGEPENHYGSRNNDTIAQGEDFSMIFMDSIPSLQASLHGNSTFMPTAQDEEDLGDETHLIINNTLESLRQEAAQSDPIDTTDTIQIPQHGVTEQLPVVEEEPGSAQEGSALKPRLGLSPWWSRKPKKLGSSPLRHQVLKSSAKQTERSVNHLETRQDEATPTRVSNHRASEAVNDDNSNMYEDSFSEIPQDYLAAATPRRPDAMPSRNNENAEIDETQLENDQREETEQQVEELEESGSQAEVPQEEEEDEHVDRDKQEEEEEHDEQQGDEAPHEELHEEPNEELHREQQDGAYVHGEEDLEEHNNALYANATAQPEARRLPTPDQTPPQLNTEEEEEEEEAQENPTEHSSRSSAAEAFASPRLREQATMGEDMNQNDESPIQAELAAEEPERPVKATPIHQMSSPLQEPLSLTQDPFQERGTRPLLSSIVRAGRVLQSVTSDPPSPGDRQKQLGSPFRSSGSRDSNNRLYSRSPQPPINFGRRHPATSHPAQHDEGPASSPAAVRHLQDCTRIGTLETTAKNRPASRESAASSMRITPPSDGAMSWVENEGPISPSLRGDNTLLEAARLSIARHPKELSSLGQTDGAGEEAAEESQAEVDDDELDIWEYEAQRETPRPARQQPFGNRVASAQKRVMAPSPWARKSAQGPVVREPVSQQSQSPKANNPALAKHSEVGEAEDYSLLSQRQSEKEKDPLPASKPNRFELSSFFSSPTAIPGMLAEKFLPRQTKPTAKSTMQAEPLNYRKSKEPVQVAPVMPTSSMFPPVPQTETHQHHGPHSGVFSPVRSNRPSTRQPLEGPSSPATPERLQPPVVAQTQHFTPRPRQTSIINQPPSSRATVTPPRMQLSHEDIHKWTQETSNAGEDLSNAGRLLRPLPPKTASPKKSSLRSPLKPHTPGRVVEFTSSVLSPADQTQLREQRRTATTAVSVGVDDTNLVQNAAPTSNIVEREQQDVAMSDTPPAATTSQSPEPIVLSQTVWSRRHWLFLDMLLQIRRHQPFEQHYKQSSRRYLGKTVKSQGQSMVLEQWHLDCVDAFKAEVGTWDEGVLAKRLFALILGEERRRRRAAVGGARKVMFH